MVNPATLSRACPAANSPSLTKHHSELHVGGLCVGRRVVHLAVEQQASANHQRASRFTRQAGRTGRPLPMLCGMPALLCRSRWPVPAVMNGSAVVLCRLAFGLAAAQPDPQMGIVRKGWITDNGRHPGAMGTLVEPGTHLLACGRCRESARPGVVDLAVGAGRQRAPHVVCSTPRRSRRRAGRCAGQRTRRAEEQRECCRKGRSGHSYRHRVPQLRRSHPAHSG